MLDWENTGVCPNGVGPRHIANSFIGVGKALLNAIMSWTWAVEQGEVALGNCTLMADLVRPIALGKGSAQGLALEWTW